MSNTPTSKVGGQANGAQAIGALAVGALAVGALALGAVAIGRLAIGRSRIRRLEIDELVVRRVHIIERLTTQAQLRIMNGRLGLLNRDFLSNSSTSFLG